MQVVRSGITRWVILIGPVAIKVPRNDYAVRGWLANRSEWKTRHRPEVNRPILTLGHVVTVYPRAERIATPDDAGPFGASDRFTYDGDEQKPANWGWFGDRWKLIDFDRSWDDPRGLVGALYFGRQERLARKWMRLDA